MINILFKENLLIVSWVLLEISMVDILYLFIGRDRMDPVLLHPISSSEKLDSLNFIQLNFKLYDGKLISIVWILEKWEQFPVKL